MPREITIAPARPDQLRAGARLLATSLGFEAEDAIPAWLMQTALACGGVALAATARGELAGFSFALPAVDAGGPFLFSCGLAVAPAFHRRGIGGELKRAQRRRALELGYGVIRWTADPLNGPALRLYLSGLGARLTAYRPGLYDEVRGGGDGVPQDDVEVEWEIAGPRRALRAVGGPTVEFPVDPRAEPLRWRLAVREAVSEALDAGWLGTGVELDRPRSRWILAFGERARRG